MATSSLPPSSRCPPSSHSPLTILLLYTVLSPLIAGWFLRDTTGAAGSAANATGEADLTGWKQIFTLTAFLQLTGALVFGTCSSATNLDMTIGHTEAASSNPGASPVTSPVKKIAATFSTILDKIDGETEEEKTKALLSGL